MSRDVENDDEEVDTEHEKRKRRVKLDHISENKNLNFLFHLIIYSTK